MNKKELLDYIDKNLLDIKGKLSSSRLLSHKSKFPHIFDCIVELTPHIKDDAFGRRIYDIRHDITETVKCSCGKEVAFKTTEYGVNCSKKCRDIAKSVPTGTIITENNNIHTKGQVYEEFKHIQVLEQCMDKRGTFSGPKAKTIPKDIISDILKSYNSLAEAVYCEVLGNSRQYCKCGTKTEFLGNNKGYREFCSKSCAYEFRNYTYNNPYAKNLATIEANKFFVLHSRDKLKEIFIRDCSKDDVIDGLLINHYEDKDVSVYKSVLYHTKFLDNYEGVNFSIRVHCIINDMHSTPQCRTCKVKDAKFINFSKGFAQMCSYECNNARDRSQQANRKIYGEVQMDIVLLTKEYIEDNLIDSVGNFNTQKFKYLFWIDDVTIAHNVYHNRTNPKCEKCDGLIPSVINFGTGYSRHCSVKCSATNKTTRKKIGDTNFLLHGYREVMHSPIIFEKNVSSNIRFKKYILPSGNMMYIQGYENIYLDYYFGLGLSEKNIIKGCSEGAFWYEFDNVKRRYYPDFYIKDTNTIIEIKSTWTYYKEVEKNRLKFRSVVNNGYNFELYVYDKKGIRFHIDWEEDIARNLAI